MKVKELIEELDLKPVTVSDGDREVRGMYACDLLSRVMNGCGEGDIWITVQTHLNIVSVAEITGAACVIIPEDIDINPYTVEKAVGKNVTVLSSSMTTSELCWRLHELLG